MKLLIISNMSHYLRDGHVVGWGPTVEEINHLATLFDSVRHIGFMFDHEAPDSSLAYTQKNIELIPLPPSGGNTLSAKIGILRWMPLYIRTMLSELKKCDVVHLRCPANVPMLGLILLMFSRKPAIRWAKYAGNWSAGRDYPLFFRFQRWLLNTGLPLCEVTVNGTWPDQKAFIHTFNNPCLTEENLRIGSEIADQKEMAEPFRLIFVGAINQKKGAGRLLEIVKRLDQDCILFDLDILGDGPDRGNYEQYCREEGITDRVTFHGWVPKDKLSGFYESAHINILPSESEGWPKVLSEGMAYGVVPIASAVASIPQVLADTGAGFAISPYDDIGGYSGVISQLVGNPDQWKVCSRKAVAVADLFSYDDYLSAVKKLLHLDTI